MRTTRSATRRGLRALVLVLIAGPPLLAGCAVREKTIDLEIRSQTRYIRVAVPAEEKLKVAVAPFVDVRADPSRLGTLTYLRGAETVVHVMGDDLGEMVAQTLVEYLKRRQGWRTWIAKPAVRPPEGGPDVTLSGRVLECLAIAESEPVGTRIAVKMAIAVQVMNQEDGSTVRMILDSRDSRWMFSFEAGDLEHMLQRTLHSNFEKLIADIQVERRVLRLKETEGAVQDRDMNDGRTQP